MQNPRQILEVWGDFACFTRPEMKVERFSYPIITPSAARGIFEAIYWKPEFRWQIVQIDLLAPPKYIALRRNEVKDKGPSEGTVLQWMKGKSDPVPIYADGDKDSLGTDMKGRTQRQTMALCDVRYRLHAEIKPWGQSNLNGTAAQFQRRASQGKCFYQPYFGCREFPAFFRLIHEEKANTPPPIHDNRDIGWMLYDVFDLSISRRGKEDYPQFISLFHAKIENGVLSVPPFESDTVHKPAKGVN